jgi:hypothetical protein
MGLAAVWSSRIWTQVSLATVGFVATFGCAALFIRPLAGVPQLTHNVGSAYQPLTEWMFTAHGRLTRASCVVVAALAVQQAVRLASGWQDWVLFAHGSRWSSDAHYFGHDIGFYVFRLNWWHRVLDLAWTTATVLLLLVALLSVTRCILLIIARELQGAPRWMRAVRPLLVAAALWFSLRAAGYYLEPFDVLTSAPGLSNGANAGLLLVDRLTSRLGLTACLVMAAICLLPALAAGIELPSGSRLPVLVSGAKFRKWRTLRWITAVVFCALLIPAIALRISQVALGVMPASPANASAAARSKSTSQSREFEHAMRAAWNLDAVQKHDVTIVQNHQSAQGDAAMGRFTSTHPVSYEIPVWDETRLSNSAQGRAVSNTRLVPADSQNAVHIDRYMEAGKQVLVGVAGREPLPEVLLFSASQVGRDRSPQTIDVPQAGAEQQGMSRRSADKRMNVAMVGVKADIVPVMPWWQRFLWAWRLRDLSVLHADSGFAAKPQNSQQSFLSPRSMTQYAQQVVPFLVPVGEPYPIVTEARVVWMIDLLSATKRFPFAPSTQRAGALRGYNAARDSVKMTMDAQTGQVAFYASPQGENEPLLQPWRRAFPSLIKRWRDMPAGLREHCRYPRALFEVQREALQSTSGEPVVGAAATAGSDAAVYSLWPDGAGNGPGNSRFVLQGMLWHRAAKNASDSNEVAVLVADCDGNEYGRLYAFRFQQRLAPDASTQTGARVVAPSKNSGRSTSIEPEREPEHCVLVPVGLAWPLLAGQGNSLPTAQRLLQVEARYAPRAGVARLNRVLVSDALDAAQPPASGVDLEQAWRRFWGEDAPRQTRTVTDLARQALTTHEMVQRAASSGDWAGFDVQRKKLRAILLELQAISDQSKAQPQGAPQSAPQSAPSPTPQIRKQ